MEITFRGREAWRECRRSNQQVEEGARRCVHVEFKGIRNHRGGGFDLVLCKVGVACGGLELTVAEELAE